MLDPLLQQTTIPLLERATAFGQKRHQVLAGNIANIDTPGYKTRDLAVQDFEKALQQAVQTRRESFQPPAVWPQVSGQVSFPSHSANPAQYLSQLLPGYSPETGPGLLPPAQQKIEDSFPDSLYRASEVSRNITFPDGGNRSIERESMEMNKNTSLQSFAIEVMMAQIRMLETVISERVT